MAKKDATKKKTTADGAPHEDRIRIELGANSDYTQHARDVAKTLETSFPHLEGRIDCVHYALPRWRTNLSWVCTVLPFAVFALVIAGEQILDVVPIPDGKELVAFLRVYRGMSLMAMGLLGGIAPYLVKSTGFDVYFNDQLVFSKHKAQRWYTTSELLKALKDKGLTKKQLKL